MVWSVQLSLCLATILSCSHCASQQSIKRIEFHSASRAFRQQIIITPDSVSKVEEDFRKSNTPLVERRKLSRDEWKQLLSTLRDVNPESITDLKSPTDKRTYDAASHGSISIIQGDSSFTHGFDDTDPHDKLRPLMEAILKLH